MPAKKKMKKEKSYSSSKVCSRDGCGGFAYFLGFLGSAIYYIQTADGFWLGVLGFLKALIWPLFLVYELLKFLAA